MLHAVDRLRHARILMYSHDTFGLGHLRRCRAIAHALVERFKGLQVLIVSGSSIAGAFEFRTRVDFLKIPSVIKLYNGEYTPLAEHTALDGTLALRRQVIQSTAESFEPDILIVDKEPLGLRGEMEPTLRWLKARGTTLVLGLRDVMDSPALLSAEWARADVLGKMEELYDAVWVYGPRDFHDPLDGLDASASLRGRVEWTGFLRREVPSGPAPTLAALPADALLVTVGGGGDGAELMHQVIAAHDHDPTLDWPIVLVLGPFMRAEERDDIRRRAASHRAIHLVDFDNRPEILMESAAGVVAMGGYNTFCEILSLDKRALIVPRVRPREEQLIRALRAASLGLVDCIRPEEAADPARLAAALRGLPRRAVPSRAPYRLDLGGLDRVADLVGGIMARRTRGRAAGTAGRAEWA
ncbi:glycosyltransferase family protein [Lichenibacterium dinghuense]|uniref:glycosyltransferase family protein n=1 Tax=Lichenibacterium dinghuense TaxID=2895977 RepID=UPI001F23E079|nr:glycosyltransferase [Lichenibacterium sp. 6Y81]